MKNFLATLFAALFVLTLTSCDRNNPGDVADDFCECLMDKDYEEAIEYVYNKKGEHSKDEKIKWTERCTKNFANVQDLKTVYIRINKADTKAEVDVDVTEENKTRKDVIKLKKVDGIWKVDM
jgi:hypothetical protein